MINLHRLLLKNRRLLLFKVCSNNHQQIGLNTFNKLVISPFTTSNNEDDKSFCFSQQLSISDKPREPNTFHTTQSTIVVDARKNRVLYKDIMEITKFKLCFLNLSVSMSTFIYYSSQLTMLSVPFFALGTMSIAMTTQVLNQIMEKIYDKKMKRTQMRPLPKQRMTTNEAYVLAFSLWSLSIGSYMMCSPDAILFSGSILSLYIFGYTPLKRINNLSMHVGALVGALPALLGSYAVNGAINFSFNDPAFLLASYIFFWQYPHFYGILYQNKEDYAKAGFKFISNDESKTYIAYAQLMFAIVAIFLIALKFRERKIMNNYTLALFMGFYAYNVIPAAMFIKNPTKYSKIMRVRSYTPFLIILASFIQASVSRSRKASN